MNREPFRLEELKIATPCTVSWDTMTGDDRKRYCGLCRLHVYNVAGMTRDEAESLIASAQPGERLCVRLYRRHDGTIITRDCPVGVAAERRRERIGLAAALTSPLGCG